jgi:hypothetical protein
VQFRRRNVLLIAVLASFFVAASDAWATNYYVSPAGSDSNAGSSVAPWRTVGRVNNAALVPGDSVLFQSGQTFSDASLYPKTGTTYDSYGTGSALLQGPGNPVYFPDGVHDITLKNLDVSGAYILVLSGGNTYNIALTGSVIHDTPYAGVATQTTDHDWTVSANTFRHTGDTAVLVGATREVIDRNTIADAGWNAGVGGAGSHGIYDKGPDTTISNNDISGVPNGQAVSLRLHGARVFGNAIHDTPFAIAFFDYDTAAAPQGNNYVYNNRLWNISGWGFYYGGQPDPNGQAPSVGFVVASNSFLFSGAAEATNLSEVPAAANVRLVNNIFSGTFGSAYRGCSTCVEDHNNWNGGSSNLPSGVGDLRLNPELSAPSALAPSASSPGVDRGSMSLQGLTYAQLCDGQPLHYCGSAPDLGAAEFLPAGGSTGPSAPAGLAVTASGLSSMSLTWLPSTDDVGVAGYDVYANGVKLGTAASSTATVGGLTCSTSYTMGVQAFDADGNRSSLVTVPGTTQPCVSAPVVGDTTSPNVTITSPASGAGVGKTFVVRAGAVDASGVAELRFFLNDVLVCVVSGPSGSCSMAAKSGWSTVTVQARDNFGNVGVAAIRLKASKLAVGATTTTTRTISAYRPHAFHRSRRP